MSTIHFRNFDYSLECPICLVDFETEGAYSIRCGGDRHPRFHQSCLDKYFDAVRRTHTETPTHINHTFTYRCPADGLEISSDRITYDHELTRRIRTVRETILPPAEASSPIAYIALFLACLSLAAYLVNALWFAGANPVLFVIGFPAYLVITPLLQLVQIALG